VTKRSGPPVRRAILAALEASPEVPAAMLAQMNGGRRPAADELHSLTERARGAIRQRDVAKLRASAVLDAARRVESAHGTIVAELPGGETIEFDSIELAPGYPDGIAIVVRPKGAPANGDGDVIIVNPPTLVAHYAGDVELPRGPHKEDPLGAIAQVVQSVYGKGR
jgi:hypothetical protein